MFYLCPGPDIFPTPERYFLNSRQLLQLPAVDRYRPGVGGLLLVGEGVLHQAQQAVGGAGHLAGLLSAPRPVVVGEMCEAHLLSQLKQK